MDRCIALPQRGPVRRCKNAAKSGGLCVQHLQCFVKAQTIFDMPDVFIAGDWWVGETYLEWLRADFPAPFTDWYEERCLSDDHFRFDQIVKNIYPRTEAHG